MEIKIKIEQNLIPDDVIGTKVSEYAENDNVESIIGEVISYDTITGIAICELYDEKKGDD